MQQEVKQQPALKLVAAVQACEGHEEKRHFLQVRVLDRQYTTSQAFALP